MNARTRNSLKTTARSGALVVMALGTVCGQTLINLGTQGKNIDFSNAPSTRPEKTGSAAPATCSIGDLFFNTSAQLGQNLYGCAAPNTWTLLSGNSSSGLDDPGANGVVERIAPNTTTAVPAPTGTIVGTSDLQTLTNKSIDASEINTGTLSGAQMPAFFGDVSTPAGSTATTLATVNSTPGTYGDGSHSVQVTVDAKGRVTAIAQFPIAGNGSSISAGPLASIPANCTTGTLYFATDQPAGQQIYTCSSTNTWTQVVSLGGSGALAFTNGSLDIVTSVVPRLNAADVFSGQVTVQSGLSLLTPNVQPACSTSVRGLFWYQNNGASQDHVQVCVYNGSAYAWINLY